MQERNYSIKQWAKDDRPREKLRSLGAQHLSNSELLAILLHQGSGKKNAVELAKDILRMANDNLRELGKLGIADLKKVKGIGEVKAITVIAALELGRRRHGSEALQREVMSSSHAIARWLQLKLQDYSREVFGVVYLNRANKINHFEVVSEGGITGTVADPRIILKKALEYNAVSIILSHNHPSGSLRPSRADQELTKKIQVAATFLDIQVLDHVIVSEHGYYSFADEGLL